MNTKIWLEILHFAIGKKFQLRTSLQDNLEYENVEDREDYYHIIGIQANECINFILEHVVDGYQDIWLELDRADVDGSVGSFYSGVEVDANFVNFKLDSDQAQSLDFVINLMYTYDGCIDIVTAIAMAEKYIDWKVKDVYIQS